MHHSIKMILIMIGEKDGKDKRAMGVESGKTNFDFKIM